MGLSTEELTEAAVLWVSEPFNTIRWWLDAHEGRTRNLTWLPPGRGRGL